MKKMVTIPAELVSMLPTKYRMLVEIYLDPEASTRALAFRSGYLAKDGSVNVSDFVSVRSKMAKDGLLRKPQAGDAEGALWVVNI